MGLGTQRVFKKSTPDNSFTIYVEKRDFVDCNDKPELIEGMLVVDRSAFPVDKKIFGSVVATYRFGREEDEILGMTFCRELYLVHEQIYPPTRAKPPQSTTTTGTGETGGGEDGKESSPLKSQDSISAVGVSASIDSGDPLSSQESLIQREDDNNLDDKQQEKKEDGEEERDEATLLAPSSGKKNSLKERILRKEGEDSIPFKFQLPNNAPFSVAMQQSRKDSGDSCSVRYFIRCYVGNNDKDKPNVLSTINLAIRKSQYAPLRAPSQLPSAAATKDFPLSPGKLFLETSLNKSLYQHGEDILATVLVQNYSNKTVKHIKVSVVQVADICMFSTGRWKVNVACTDTRDRCPISPGKTFQKRFTMSPTVEENKTKYGVFTQGRLANEDDTLSSTTLVSDKERSEYFGIIISYVVKVKLFLSSLGPLPQSELSCVMPFLLMNSDPNAFHSSSLFSSSATASSSSSSPSRQHPRTSREEADIEKGETRVVKESLGRGRMRSMSLIG